MFIYYFFIQLLASGLIFFLLPKTKMRRLESSWEESSISDVPFRVSSVIATQTYLTIGLRLALFTAFCSHIAIFDAPEKKGTESELLNFFGE